MRFNCLLVSIMILATLGSACGEGVLPETRETVRFSALETDEVTDQTIEDPGPTVNAGQLSTYQPIVEGVRENRVELLAREDVEGQLERIEGVFIATGEYLELVAYYQDHVAKAGVDNAVGRRLAWALIRLGQKKAARDLLDQLLEEAPRDATVHFLDGSFYLQTERESVEDRKKAIAAWERAIELDPDFRGYEGITAKMIENQLQRLRSSLPEDAAVAAEPTGETETPEQQAVSTARAVEATARLPLGELAPAEAEDAPGPDVDAETTDVVVGEPPSSKERQYKLLVARGEIALSQGKFEDAETLFLKAKELRPEGFRAELGHLRAGWGVESARNEIARRARSLAERELSGAEAFQLGRFVWTKMQDRELATKLLNEAKEKSPERRKAIENLLESMN